MMGNRPLGVRTRLLLAVVGAVTIALTIGVVAFNLFLHQRLSASATAVARAQAEAEISALHIVAGKLAAPGGPEVGKNPSTVWIFAEGRQLEAPRIGATVSGVARSLAGGPERSLDVGSGMRLYAMPVVDKGTRLGTVVAGVSLDAYDETAAAALVGSLVLAALLLVAVTVLTRWILGRALLPVSRMTESASAWSEHDLDHRFDLGEPYDELTRLAATLDVLLERIAASVRHEQRFAAELSHELRTPLARIAAESELALARERSSEDYGHALRGILESATQMTSTVEALVSAARHDAGLSHATSDARTAITQATEGMRHEAAQRHTELTLLLPSNAVQVGVDEQFLVQIMQPLIENAARYAASAVQIELERRGPQAVVTICDDGPGVREDERWSIFEPGVRGSAAAGEREGAGLGLALAQRLARSAGGDITVETESDGARFALRLPAV